MKIYIVVTDVVNDFTYSRKSVNTRVVIRIYDMTLSTGKQRRHMIKNKNILNIANSQANMKHEMILN